MTKLKDFSLSEDWFELVGPSAEINEQQMAKVMLGKVHLPWEQAKEFREKVAGDPEKFNEFVNEAIRKEQLPLEAELRTKFKAQKNSYGQWVIPL